MDSLGNVDNEIERCLDDSGGLFVYRMLRTDKRHLRKEHAKKCAKNLPVLEVRSPWSSDNEEEWESYRVNQEKAIQNRKVLAFIAPCCGTWYRPVLHFSDMDYSDGWEWKKVSKLRRWWWRRRGII